MRERLGKYELLDEIGHGGMATVHRARDTALDRLVALKVLHPHLRGADEARSRFAREARSVARLHHPNILEIYDFAGEDADESFLVMELLTGPTLKAWAEAHEPMLPEIAGCFTLEILEALEAAHAAGIVHRDVKPENVLLHDGREVKLTDFGIAQMVDSQSFTATGQILGSPCHMAPEQIERGEAHPRSDVFSAGTVLYYLATQTLPFAGKNPHQVLKAVVDGKLADPLRIRPEIGARLRGILLRAMARDPDDRFPDAPAFAEALRSFLADSGIEDPAATLRAYLADPVQVQHDLRARIVGRLTALGVAAADRGDVPEARDAFDRVLALDEGNEVVLARVAGLGRERRRRIRRAGVAAGAVAMIGVAAVAVAVARSAGGGAVVVEPADGADQSVPDAPPTTASPPSAVPEPSAPAEPTTAAAAGAEDDRSSSASPRRARRRQSARPPPPRLVRFDFRPRRPLLSIDGAPPRQVDELFQGTPMRPGRHVFRFQSTDVCCEDDVLRVHIPQGDGPYVLSHRLPVKPASFIVYGPAGDVELHDGDQVVAQGRTGDMIDVPMSASTAVFGLRVTVPGREVYKRSVRLEAGKPEDHRLTALETAGGPN